MFFYGYYIMPRKHTQKKYKGGLFGFGSSTQESTPSTSWSAWISSFFTSKPVQMEQPVESVDVETPQKETSTTQPIVGGKRKHKSHTRKRGHKK